MQNLKNTDMPAAAAVTGSGPVASQLHDVEELSTELKRLLVQYESILEEENIRHEVEVLERWMESYRRGLAAAGKISETGTGWLASVRDKLKLAADEMQRLEEEGGNPANKEQLRKTDELLKAIGRIDKVMVNIEHNIEQLGNTESA